ncbi:MAG TPA: hypothetical protein V6D08_15515 [Candidatus Obscuribacterales bacterium]
MFKQSLLALTIALVWLAQPGLAHEDRFLPGNPGQPWVDMPGQDFQPPQPAVNPWQDFPVVTSSDQQRLSAPTTRQTIALPQNREQARLPRTMTAQYGHHPGVILPVSHLPPTRLSSFVADSGYDENIYGDEGTIGKPPIMGFEYENTIEAGLCNCHGEGITTGHHPDKDMPHGYL